MSFTLWFTGLPASGKTTLATIIHGILARTAGVQLLDSDEFYVHLGEHFAADARGRALNNRCMAIVCQYLNRHGIICIAAATSPRRETRDADLRLIGSAVEVYCQCPVEIAAQRDAKGLYRLAKKGMLPGFTGIGAEYEAPLAPDITVDTGGQTVDSCVGHIMNYLSVSRGIHREMNHEKQ